MNARAMLESGGYTCVLCRGDAILTDKRRGVRPLLDLLDSRENFVGYSAADKVVGKAAAFLYQLLGVEFVYYYADIPEDEDIDWENMSDDDFRLV